VLQRVFDLLDNRWVGRASNAVFLVGVVGFMGTRVIDALQHVDWLTAATYVCIALGLALMLLERVGKRRAQSLVEVDKSRLWAEIFTEEKEARKRRAQQIAESNIDREAND
jgi:hypothetical protein